MQQRETQFSELLDVVGHNARTCTTHAYSELAIHHAASGSQDIFDAVNRDAGFWNAVLNAHQTAAFLALGRLYDKKKESATLDSLLSLAETNPGVFSRSALAARKQASGISADDAKHYVSDAWEPGKVDGFAPLRALHDAERDEYEEKVSKIRHEVFAHAIATTREQQGAHFAGLLVRDFERLVLTPYRVTNALWELFHNGREPKLAEMPSNIGDVVAARPGPYSQAFHHVNAAGRVLDFLDSLLTRTPAED